MSHFCYLLPCILVWGCHDTASLNQSSNAQGSEALALELSRTKPSTSVYGFDSARGQVVQEAAPEGHASSPAWVWQDPQSVAVWGSLGEYAWVYPLAQDEAGQPTSESMALAHYALASDMWLVPSGSLESRQSFPVAQSALYLPAQSASCPRYLLSQSRLVPQGLVRADQDAPLLSRGATGDYLVYQGADGGTELVSSNCSHLIDPWTGAQEDELLEQRPQGSWLYGRSSDWLLQTLVEHSYGEGMLIEAPEELPDLALRQPLCQSPHQESDVPAIRLYSAESFVLQVLAKLPVVLRQQLQPHWDDVLNTPFGREWLEHFSNAPTDASIDSGMTSLQRCNDGAPPLQLATNLAGLRTSTSNRYVSKLRSQLQHPAFENRLLEATQLLNEAGRRYEMANSSHPAYRFHRKRGKMNDSIIFSLLYFDGRQSLATQTVPGIPSTLVFSNSHNFTGLARTYGHREYLVNLDAARLVDMLENKLYLAMQDRGTDNPSDFSDTDLRATQLIRTKDPSFPAWMASLITTAYEEFEHTSIADRYQLLVHGLSSPSPHVYIQLILLKKNAESRAKEAWKQLLVRRFSGRRKRIVLGVTTVQGFQTGSDERGRFEAELFRLVDACGSAVNVKDFKSYLTFGELGGVPGYYMSFDYLRLRRQEGLSFENMYETCMPLLEDPPP